MHDFGQMTLNARIQQVYAYRWISWMYRPQRLLLLRLIIAALQFVRRREIPFWLPGRTLSFMNRMDSPVSHAIIGVIVWSIHNWNLCCFSTFVHFPKPQHDITAPNKNDILSLHNSSVICFPYYKWETCKTTYDKISITAGRQFLQDFTSYMLYVIPYKHFVCISYPN